APLEARADLLERRDQRLVEHHLGVDAVLEPLLGQLLHGRRVADQRVVVQSLEDLLVRHAAPRFASWWRGESSRTSSRPSSSRRSGVTRIVGAETLTAATRFGPTSGAATAARPGSSSSTAVA